MLRFHIYLNCFLVDFGVGWLFCFVLLMLLFLFLCACAYRSWRRLLRNSWRNRSVFMGRWHRWHCPWICRICIMIVCVLVLVVRWEAVCLQFLRGDFRLIAIFIYESKVLCSLQFLFCFFFLKKNRLSIMTVYSLLCMILLGFHFCLLLFMFKST